MFNTNISKTRGVGALGWLALIAVLLLNACSQAEAPAPSVESVESVESVGSGGTVVIRSIQSSPAFDPSPQAVAGGLEAIPFLYDSLVIWGPDRTIIPGLAESWTVTPTTVTFKLRSDATCSDGTKVTPTVVANSVKRMMATVRGVGLFGAGPFQAVADDAAGTFAFTPPTKNVYAVIGFTSSWARILCPAGLVPGFDFLKNAAGSGPYVLESVTADRVTMTLRPEYTWGPNNTTAKSPGIPAKVIMRMVENDTTAANLMLAGEIDVASVIGADARRLAADESVTRYVNPGYAPVQLAFNQVPGLPGADIEVRRAVQTAIDREGYNQAAFDGTGEVASSPFGDKAECFEPATRAMIPQPSTENAKQILLKAGYTAGSDGKLQKDGKPLQLVVIGGPPSRHGNGPEYVAAQLTKVGITVDLRVTDVTTYTNSLVGGSFDVAIAEFGSPDPLPISGASALVGPWRSEGGYNAFRTRSPLADSQWAQALETTGEESCNLFKAWQRTIVSTVQSAPMVQAVSATYTHGGVTLLWPAGGTPFSPFGSLGPVAIRRMKN